MSIYTLGELNEMVRNLQLLIQDGAAEEDIVAYLNTVELERETKLENYAMVIRNLENENVGLKAEEERFAKRRKANESAIARMKEKMAESLDTVEPDKKGVKRLKTEKFIFSFRKSSTVEVDESKVSRFYYKPKYEVDKSAIKKVLSKGGIVPGAKLVENQTLQIK